MIEALAESLLNGALVGLPVAAAAIAYAHTLRTASARYRLHIAALVVVLLLPALHVLRSAIAPGIVRTSSTSPAVVTPPVQEPTAARVVADPIEDDDVAAASFVERLPALRPAPLRPRVPVLRNIALATLGCVLALMLALAPAIRRLIRLRARSQAAPPALRAHARARLHAWGVTAPVSLAVSRDVRVPATIGNVDPLVLLPLELVPALSADEFDHVLAHETAHVLRRDHIVRLGESVIGAVLWFNPAVHWLIRALRRERELACDEWVLARTGAQPAAYAETLLRIAQRSTGAARQPRLALSMASELRTRIDSLFAAQPQDASRRLQAVRSALTVGAIAFATLAFARPVEIDARLELPALLPTAAHATVPDASAARARVDAYLRTMEQWGVNGAVLLAVDGDVVLRTGYGVADRSAGTPWTPDMTFNAGAVAKLLTAAAVLALQEEGKLRVSDLASTYIGPLPGAKAAVTIEHLLTHTDGLTQVWAPVNRATRAEFLDAVRNAPIDYAPGTDHRYGDVGHAVLAAIIEIAAGVPYETYVRTRILEPAGMKSTFFDDEPQQKDERVVVEYTEPFTASSAIERRAHLWGRRGTMGVRTTLDDLFRLHQALTTDAVLAPATRELMFVPRLNAGRSTQIAYGWEVGVTDRGTRVHNRLSAWPGNSVEIAYDADAKVFVALVTTARTNWAAPKYNDVLRAAVGANAFTPPRIETATDVAPGEYALDGAQLRIRRAGDGLRASLEFSDGGAPFRDAPALPIANGRLAVLDWTNRNVYTIANDPEHGVSVWQTRTTRKLKAAKSAS